MAASRIQRGDGTFIAGHRAVEDPDRQVLLMARRTAEALVSAAEHQADQARADARVAADRISLEARMHANRIRAEADTVLAAARIAAELIVDQAAARADRMRDQAEAVLAAAREQAGQIVGAGQVRAEQVRLRAEQQFEEAAGGLGRQRAGLHQQVEALEAFDRECRRQLTTVFQRQLQALWAPPGNRGPCRPRYTGRT